MDKPNLVYITADQLKASAAPILGNRLISCPFMEGLAAEGITHGHLRSTFPTGTFNSGRRNALVQAGRNREYSYIRDPQYGDEAYDLTRDPRELDNLLLHRGAVPDGVSRLRDELDRWEEACLGLRRQLNVIPGDRGFEPGWE